MSLNCYNNIFLNSNKPIEQLYLLENQVHRYVLIFLTKIKPIYIKKSFFVSKSQIINYELIIFSMNNFKLL